MKILALDTATEGCSVALWIDGELRYRETELERGHAELILPMIDELLKEGGVRLRDLNAVAFGRGPGGFTGVRLCASITQALAFAADLPVVPISDLRAVAQRMHSEVPDSARIVVCNDARMREVYWACYQDEGDGLMRLTGEERVSKPGDVSLPDSWTAVAHGAGGGADGAQDTSQGAAHESSPGVHGVAHGAGRGFRVYGDLLAPLAGRLIFVNPQILPRAREIALLALPELLTGKVVTAEEAIPVYLRDDVARAKSPAMFPGAGSRSYGQTSSPGSSGGSSD